LVTILPVIIYYPISNDREIKMRLWTLHPEFLDRVGLVAVWREALLAQAVLKGNTKGYKNHPQLIKFRLHTEPLHAIAYYLQEIFDDAIKRGYKFDQTKFTHSDIPQLIPTTSGQLEFEFHHLLTKLQKRSIPDYERIRNIKSILPHPLFKITPGKVEDWEKGHYESNI
jgi:hypothetical protein